MYADSLKSANLQQGRELLEGAAAEYQRALADELSQSSGAHGMPNPAPNYTNTSKSNAMNGSIEMLELSSKLPPSLRPELTISYKNSSENDADSKMSSNKTCSEKEHKPEPSDTRQGGSGPVKETAPHAAITSTASDDRKASPISVKSVSSINRMDDKPALQPLKDPLDKANTSKETIDLISDDELQHTTSLKTNGSAGIKEPQLHQATNPTTPSKLQEEMEDVMNELLQISKQKSQNSSPTGSCSTSAASATLTDSAPHQTTTKQVSSKGNAVFMFVC